MPRKPRLSLTKQIFIGLALGVLVGYVIHEGFGADQEAIEWIRVISRVFLRAIKLIIAPLVFSTLVVGIAGAGHLRDVGRVALKAFIYFEIVTTLALVIGLGAVNLTQPGKGIDLPPEVSPEARDLGLRAGKMTPQEHIVEIFPGSVVDAMARNDVLQIVVFSILFGLAVAMLKEKGKPVLNLCESLAEVMFKITGFVMNFAPYGVGAAMAVTVGKKGLDVLVNLGLLVATLYGALAVFIIVVLGSVALLIRLPIRDFWRLVKEPVLLAFTTTSSEAALPKALENMPKLGVPKRIVGLVLPMGYSFNLDGSTLYLSLAAIFVAQAANRELSVSEQLMILLTLMLTTKGIAAVPRAALVVLSGTLASFGLPLEGIVIILGVDELMDMARTATNVLGNCLATVAVAKWEKQFPEVPARE